MSERSSRIIRKNGGQAVSRLPLIGNIRIGEKRKNSAGKEYPVSLDYFKATGDYASKFYEVHDEKPTKLQVIFISDEDFQSCYEEWDGRDKEGRRSGYGDGEKYWLWNGKEYKETTDKEEVKQYSKVNNVKWKPILTLHFIIPKIRGVFGCWKFSTSGDKSSMIAIREMYDEIKSQAGTVVNIPFDLTVKKVKSNKPGEKSVFPVVNLVPNISSENMEQLREFLSAGTNIKQLGMLTEEKLAALPQRADDIEILSPTEDKAFRDKTVNLCDSCELHIATCDSEPKFGTGEGNDNVWDCNKYRQRTTVEPKITSKQVSDLKEVGFTDAEIKKASEYPPMGTMFPVDPKDPEKPENSFDN